ncbi:MAG: hypothetical protein IJA15_08715, partial [Clostridia bacterium]|nr:hypothetical protein [Clostridia bacterium]
MNVVDATLDFYVDSVIASLAKVLTSIKAIREHSDKINAVAATLEDVLDGTLRTIRLDGSVPVCELIDDADLLADAFFYDSETLNVFFEELKGLYGDTIAKNIFTAILDFDVNDVINSITNVLVSVKAIRDRSELVYDIAEVLEIMLEGTLGEVRLHGTRKMADLVMAAYDVVAHFTEEEFVKVISEEIAGLYGDALTREFLTAIPGFFIDDVVAAAANVINVIFPDEPVVDQAAKLIMDLLDGRLNAPGVQGQQLITVVIEDVKAILYNYYKSDASDVVFAELIKLYEGAMVKDVVQATLDLPVEEVISSVVNVVKVFLPEEVLVDQIAKLVDDLVDGTLGAPVFNGEQLVTVVVEDVEAIIDTVAGEILLITDICKVLKDLYEGVTLANFASATLDLPVDNVINAVAYVVGYNLMDVDTIAKLLTDLLEGSISAPYVYMDQLVPVVVEDV